MSTHYLRILSCDIALTEANLTGFSANWLNKQKDNNTTAGRNIFDPHELRLGG